jgi:hypothetical protein
MVTILLSLETQLKIYPMSEVFPLPVAPAMATDMPLLTQRVRKSSSSAVAVPQWIRFSLVI